MKYTLSLLLIILFTGSKAANVSTLTLPVMAAAIHKQDSAKPVPGVTMDYKKLPLYAGHNSISSSIHQLLKENYAVHAIAGYSRQGRPIDIYYFPGSTGKRALILGGMHGSELSSVEIVQALLVQLRERDKTPYAVILIPCLFPDNAAYAKNSPSLIGGTSNTGRYSGCNAADPNRQMPAPGKSFNIQHPVDLMGRQIENENQLLLQVIQEYRPSRILNIHAIRNPNQAGVYADPRSDHRGYALGFDSDSSLAIDMAKTIAINGGHSRGNRLDSMPTARYHNDPPVAPAGYLQKRNLVGSQLPNQRGHGVSLGGWATTAVADSVTGVSRAAIRLITMEFPGYGRPQDYADPQQQQSCKKLIEVYAQSILHVFLEDNYPEVPDYLATVSDGN